MLNRRVAWGYDNGWHGEAARVEETLKLFRNRGNDGDRTAMKPILNRSGNVVGYIHEVGNRREVRSRSNALVAWYDKHIDKTFKRDGNFAGFGDQAIRFLQEE